MGFFKKSIVKLLVIAFIACPGFLFAEDILNANDLELTPSVTAAKKVGNFTIVASEEKNVAIDAPDKAATSKDGDIFNNRINLKGAGSADARAVKFTAKKNAKITVYCASSSKTDSRVLKLVSASGDDVAEITGGPYTDENVSVGTSKIPADGEYFLTSAKGGMYIYQIIIK
jgi:hypothetical protein